MVILLFSQRHLAARPLITYSYRLLTPICLLIALQSLSAPQPLWADWCLPYVEDYGRCPTDLYILASAFHPNHKKLACLFISPHTKCGSMTMGFICYPVPMVPSIGYHGIPRSWRKLNRVFPLDLKWIAPEFFEFVLMTYPALISNVFPCNYALLMAEKTNFIKFMSFSDFPTKLLIVGVMQ